MEVSSPLTNENVAGQYELTVATLNTKTLCLAVATVLTLLRPYNDYNTAIAYLCMDYNASAMQILESIERTAQVNYMLAVLYSRRGDEEKAVECYVRSCSQDPTYVHRGNLDPEISVLIRRYGLNAQPEDEFEYSL